MLDLGCGSVSQKEPGEGSGFEYLGADYHSVYADVLIDAHSLPFREDSFDFIYANSVLEHLQYPVVAMRETQRVLRPDAIFLGAVSFMEPFHMNSFYHHTHLGVASTLQQAGFEVLSIVPSGEWSVLRAHCEMGFLPGVPETISRWLIASLQALHRTCWKLAGRKASQYNEDARIRNTTGSFAFAATKRKSGRRFA
jgi:SAM-dependent methyltransferase